MYGVNLNRLPFLIDRFRYEPAALTCSPWLRPKKLNASLAVKPVSNGYLPRVSHLSANDKGDNEVKPRAVHKSLGI